jgi:hypothetical protein
MIFVLKSVGSRPCASIDAIFIDIFSGARISSARQ